MLRQSRTEPLTRASTTFWRNVLTNSAISEPGTTQTPLDADRMCVVQWMAFVPLTPLVHGLKIRLPSKRKKWGCILEHLAPQAMNLRN